MRFETKNIAVNSLRDFKKLEFAESFLLNDSDIYVQRLYSVYDRAVGSLKDYIENEYHYALTSPAKEDFHNQLMAEITGHELYDIPKKKILKKIAEYNEITQAFIESMNGEGIKPKDIRSTLDGFYRDEKIRKLCNIYKEIEIVKEVKGRSLWFNGKLIDTTRIEDYFSFIERCISLFKKAADKLPPLLQALPPPQTEEKTQPETIIIKPNLKPEAVQPLFDILKDFFRAEQQTELKQIIETGNNASEKLLFKGNGNRLTDTFKKLIEHDFITGCEKRDLINWIIASFEYTHQNKLKKFIYDTVEKTISKNATPCKSPLIEIKSGQIQKFEQPRHKKQTKY